MFGKQLYPHGVPLSVCFLSSNSLRFLPSSFLPCSSLSLLLTALRLRWLALCAPSWIGTFWLLRGYIIATAVGSPPCPPRYLSHPLPVSELNLGVFSSAGRSALWQDFVSDSVFLALDSSIYSPNDAGSRSDVTGIQLKRLSVSRYRFFEIALSKCEKMQVIVGGDIFIFNWQERRRMSFSTQLPI